MRILIVLMISAVALSLLLVAACTDRGANPRPDYIGDSGVFIADHSFFEELSVQLRNRFQQFFLKGYAPKVREWNRPPDYTPPEKLPMLVLLPPHEGDDYYYFNHGLTEVANELIESGEIDPMIIWVPGNDPTFGGFWWSGGFSMDSIYWTGGSGNYDALIGGTMIEWLWNNTANLGIEAWDTSMGGTGIGGIGTGAYGAFRAAMKHPGRFGSISAVDGPLDFDGWDGTGGLLPVFQRILDVEQPELRGRLNYAREWDTSGVFHLSSLITGGSIAFSPNDTLVQTVITVRPTEKVASAPDRIVESIDTVSSFPFVTDTTFEQRRWKIAGDTIMVVDTVIDTLATDDIDTTISTVAKAGHTLVDEVVSASDYNLHFHLPFDENGNPYNTPNEPIWSLWMRNNLQSIYQNEYAAGGNDFSETRVWFGISQNENDPRNFPEMTASWANFVANQTNPAEITKFRYLGSDENPAINDEYLNYLLREMLIFHDRAFKAAREAEPSK